MPGPSPKPSRTLLLILAAGLVARILAMPLPGSEDMPVNQVWGARAIEQGLTRAYLYDDSRYLYKLAAALQGAPYSTAPVFYQTELGPLDHVPAYPPLSILTFEMSARLGRFLKGGRLRDGPVLNASFNLLPVLAALGTALLIWRFASREGLRRPALAIAAFWLNPVMLYHTPVLGFVDAVVSLLGLLSLVFLYDKRYTLCLLALALGCVTKPQAVLVLPVVALVLATEAGRRLLARLAPRFVLFLALPLVPFAAAGRALPALYGSLGAALGGMLSWQQANLWWLVSWLFPALAGEGSAALRGQVHMVNKAQFAGLFGFSPQWVALPLVAAFLAANLFYLSAELRRGNRLAIFWAAALDVYGYTMLTIYPHENHLYPFFVYTLPLLAVGRPAFVRLYAILCAVFALNMYLFIGLGRGLPAAHAAVKMGAGFDLSVALALFNLGVFVWLLRAPRWHFAATGAGASEAARNEAASA